MRLEVEIKSWFTRDEKTIEDNNLSVCTNTRKTWNQKKLSYEGLNDEYITYYHYKLKYTHY